MVNQGTILGRVGKIDVRSTNSGTKVCNLSMVTSKKYIQNGEKKEKVTWHNVTMFNKLAELAEKYVAIGDVLYVQGEMDSQKYQAQDGSERTKYFLAAHDMRFIPKGAKEHKSEVTAEAESSFGADFEDSDIPF